MKTTPHFSRFHYMEDIDQQIESHLSDANLTVQRLTRLVGMSRTDLHRKLSYSVGMSTTEYVRKKRLEKAVELLSEDKDSTIADVALKVGFINQGYFSKRFKELFGTCPLVWRKKMEHME